MHMRNVHAKTTIDDDDFIFVSSLSESLLRPLYSERFERSTQFHNTQRLNRSERNLVNGRRCKRKKKKKKHQTSTHQIGFVELGAYGFRDVKNPEMLFQYRQYCTIEL